MSFEMRIRQRLQLRRHREFGRGKYQAKQVAGEIVVTATGDTPTPNYKVWLATGPERSFPPVLELWRMKPVGVQAQILTPFSVHLTFDTGNQPIDSILIRDTDGVHEIMVEQFDSPRKRPERTGSAERVPANSFRLALGKISVGYATTSLMGVPIFNLGEHHFMGDDLHIVDTEIGQQVTVVVRQLADLELVTFTLIVPLVLLDGCKPAKVEFVGVTATHHTTTAGPPLGQSIEYGLSMLCGIAEVT
jgi:hypothetical protein